MISRKIKVARKFSINQKYSHQKNISSNQLFGNSERPNQQKSIPEASAMSTEASAEALAESLHKKMGQNDTKMGNFHQKFAL